MRISVKGVVQGVGFRPTVYRIATQLGLNGNVRNDGPDVIIDVDDADKLLNALYANLPSLSVIEKVTIDDVAYKGGKGFSISASASNGSGVSIPCDTSICGKCLDDMKSGKRKDYPFTTCTECGARFTLLSSLPYDRANTSMSEFPMCDECSKEYNSADDRRFHHQTICCSKCGPKYSLYDRNGNAVSEDPIKGFAKNIDSGMIGVVKGIGGMHICSSLDKIADLRKWYGRSQKPFAIMVRDADSIFGYADPTDHELNEVTSNRRPIVLMDKKVNDVTEMVSPGLDNIGIFLPYTGMHHLLFENMTADAMIMTSANIPGEPMILSNKEIMGMGAHTYLLHDQTIINRADDTVLRIHYQRPVFIRRSRGYTPWHIDTEYKGNVLALGAQENITAAVASKGRIHVTQHIGDHDTEGVAEYLEEASRFLMKMIDCVPDIVAADLHPGYGNRRFAKRMCEETNAEMMEIQHHWAHCASLLIDNEKDECVALAVDGTGYGDDGNAWGGEVLYATLEGYERIAHLQYIPLLGSEKALYDLRRLKFAVDNINGKDGNMFTDEETNILNKMMGKSVRSSSLGRLLDTLAFSLNVCEHRTYDGEPAMKLEPLLSRGKMLKGYETEIAGKEIMTAPLFSIFKSNERKEDIAYSVVRSVIREMVSVACDTASSKGMNAIGVTGGVSYNGPICKMIDEESRERGMSVMYHKKIPNGDGGISAGQAAIALKRLNK